MLRTLTAGAIACVFQFQVLAQESAERPLLMPGKRTLYQRALANPGSRLYAQPSLDAAAQPVIPFTVFYAYGRKALNDSKWVRVGSDSHGSVRGWIQQDSLIPWHQALTVTFKASKDIDRVLLFRDRKSLKRLVEKKDLKTYARLYQEAVLGTLSPDSPVIAIQPEANIDIEDDFYLVPIKRHEDAYLGTERARLLQVASVPLESGAPAAARLNNAPGDKAPTYRSGIVFVIDSTQSMRPYIERTREVVRKVYDTIDAARLSHQVSFGLTSYRDFVRSAPEAQYLVRNFVSLKEGGEPQRFFSQVQTLDAATTSNADFIEDAFAGIKSAIEANPWDDFDARNIVLVTDAGAREANDAFSSTRLGVDEIRQLAQDRGIAIWVLHLLTPRGAKNHRKAERQYKRLSEYPGIGDLYYAVGMGKVEDFGRGLQTLADQLAEQVGKVATGDAARPSEHESEGQGDLVALKEKVAKLGYALQMRYLRKVQGERPPAVFDAWLVDRDFKDPKRSSIEVRVLMSRDQLSDLRNGLQQALDLAEEGVLSPRNFINELKSMAARLSRDPKTVGEGAGLTLAELGYLNEYVEDLPYVSEVTGLSLADWEEWPAERQVDFVSRLESKISYYQALHDHTDLWVSLDGGPVSGESVFPVLLDMLP
ncbi:MAG: vWA domain-containing protein [Gammaproteobacteria bacterium]